MLKNDDVTNIKMDEVIIKDELSDCNNIKKISKRLKTTHPKQLVVKSVSRINLSTSKKPQIFSCKMCKKIFSYSERFEAHKLEHEGKKISISCATCNKTFMTWSGLRRHKESEHTRVNLDVLKCRVCGKISKNKHTLHMHMKTHGERKLCVCDVCGKKFVSTTVLKAHLETHEENRERKHECQQCGKKFFSNTVLLSHISKRHSGKKFICQICTFPFSEKSNLIRHMQLHEGKKMFKCDLCDKSYAASSSLVEHKRVHSGERPFTCLYCPKSFSAKKRLDDHHRIHTGEKPHKCSICSQGFTQRGTLKRHMKIHDKFPSTLS
ncbi:zinc finger protein OZF-like [Battus philenor]|uniref:zinc finger protein OZF-like n=1 Tax=Battus philenor TaxID=42288 RepID=UPI0035D0077C